MSEQDQFLPDDQPGHEFWCAARPHHQGPCLTKHDVDRDAALERARSAEAERDELRAELQAGGDQFQKWADEESVTPAWFAYSQCADYARAVLARMIPNNTDGAR